ncbi:Uncharacterized protein M6B38_220685 [Iris pallida]|uniref:Hexosyltransferase n=1 Tax=Iris pallida TaxID=29817 RepID=A0AAX6DYK8_IRIPA|nr:Uncharacterized protein M6B38_220685 [Iris pallida]
MSSSGPGLHRRPVNPSASAAGGPLRPDVDPPPKPPRVLQLLSIALIVLLACLQLLPATHFRGPSGPGMGTTWIPFHSVPTSTEEVGDGRIHVVSWTDCLDLRALAVLANSTISNSRLAENVYFHFFLPEGEDEKLSYYKLKVLFPHLNLDIMGQKEVKEKLQTALPEWELLWPSLHELLPLIIPSITTSFSRFIYLSSDVIIKGHIEELFGVDLGPYAIASAEDCTKQLGDYVKIDIVNAIQRTAAKTWVSSEPYDTHACIPDFRVVLVDMKNVDKELVEAIPWWNKVLSLKDERHGRRSILPLH